jgi:hypothetical protein
MFILITPWKLFSIFVFLLENNGSSGTDSCFYWKIFALRQQLYWNIFSDFSLLVENII